MIKFTVLGVPTAKGRARSFNGRHLTPAKTKHTENDFRAQAILQHRPEKPHEVPVRLDVEFYMPIPASYTKKRKKAIAEGLELPAKKPDLDNLVKLVKDALNEVYWNDDCQVVEVHAKKLYGEQPRTEVKISEVRG